MSKAPQFLDTFAPISSAIGAAVGIILSFIFDWKIINPVQRSIDYQLVRTIAWVIITTICAYIFCTCTHNRKYRIFYSTGSLGSLIGVLISTSIIYSILFIPLKNGSYGQMCFGISGFIIIPICAGLGTHLFHKRFTGNSCRASGLSPEKLT